MFDKVFKYLSIFMNMGKLALILENKYAQPIKGAMSTKRNLQSLFNNARQTFKFWHKLWVEWLDYKLGY